MGLDPARAPGALRLSLGRWTTAADIETAAGAGALTEAAAAGRLLDPTCQDAESGAPAVCERNP